VIALVEVLAQATQGHPHRVPFQAGLSGGLQHEARREYADDLEGHVSDLCDLTEDVWVGTVSVTPRLVGDDRNLWRSGALFLLGEAAPPYRLRAEHSEKGRRRHPDRRLVRIAAPRDRQKRST
jgi:hypothetical protein